MIAQILTTNNDKTKHYIQLTHKKETEKNALVNRTIYVLIWYAS